MKYIIRNVITKVERDIYYNQLISSAAVIKAEDIRNIQVLRKSLDARKKTELKYIFSFIFETDAALNTNENVSVYEEPHLPEQKEIKINDNHPFIIGAGPAGYFAALALVEQGLQPWIFERGDIIEKRNAVVNRFWKEGILNPESNVQFGEGGAGAFSDGKLTARTRNYYSDKVFEYLVRFGAKEDILYEALPHVGTEVIRAVFRNIREFLLANSCRIFWNHQLENLEIEKNLIKLVTINKEKYSPETLIIGTGNSSRDTFRMLLKNHISLESKPFAVGFRIEHPQKMLNERSYGKNADISLIGAANYKLVYKAKERGIYSFCMCPGGHVISGASENEMQVTNGMSFSKRDGKFGNSAIVASVDDRDFGKSVLSGLEFQEYLESRTYNLLKSYALPTQKAGDFLKDKLSESIKETSSPSGFVSCKLNNLLKNNIETDLKKGLLYFDRIIPGFLKEGTLLGTETRTSSSVRIKRNEVFRNSVSAENLYPVGEGAGYAGGIISSAADGYTTGKMFVK